ncbi:MAG: lipopolysaccharide export system protein LptC [Flavobacteriales bacterium]|jgi:lipopolysaccharide export system protein LptC
MSVFKLISYATLTLLSIATILFFSDSPKDILGSLNIEQEESESIPYAFITNAKTKHYADDGTLTYTFKAQHLYHYRELITADTKQDAYTNIEMPEIIVMRDGKPWKINAHHGKIDADQNIELNDEVTIIQRNEDDSETLMETDSLLFKPLEKLALTDKPVTITSPFGKIEATGMRADIARKKIKLLSKVRGVYEP